jgi:hypothetical protein
MGRRGSSLGKGNDKVGSLQHRVDSGFLSTTLGQRAKRGDEGSALPPNLGWAWHEEDLTDNSALVEEVLAMTLLHKGEGRRRVSESDFSRTMENRNGWVMPSSHDRCGVSSVAPGFSKVRGDSARCLVWH